ncbi:rhamnosyl transferase [Methylobacterium sp. ID0610]|uniref:rhamnosyl transferase n=1 Tax=Methylobacterium carpenticola TaxID=3344827 RepID=UPI003686E06B
MDADRVLAGIVVYEPDRAQLLRLVTAIAPQVGEVVIYANSAVPEAFESDLRAVAGPALLSVLRPPGNVGLGSAYNAIAGHARIRRSEFVLLLDQDSLPGAGCVAALRAGFIALDAAGERPALIGPQPLGGENAPMRAPRDGAAGPRDLVPVSFAISSGSLIRREVLDAVGPFRADFFIDAIDTEWCLRARARGFSVWMAAGVPMTHALGRGVMRLPLGLLVPDQPPRRVYTMIRNQLALMRLGHVPASFKVKALVSLPLRIAAHLVRDRGSRAMQAAIGRGLVDGVRNRLGPP